MDDVLGAHRMMKLRREQPFQFRSRALLRDEKLFICKIRPANPRILAKRMMLRESHDHPLAPEWKHAAVPRRRLASHDRDIDGVAREGAKQPLMASIDRAHIHIRQAPMVFDQRRMHVPSRWGGMNADGQEAKFATAPAPEPLEFRIHVIKYPLGARDELQPHRGEACAAVRP